MKKHIFTRRTLSLTLVVCATLGLFSGLPSPIVAAETADAPQIESGRKIQINDDWRFCYLSYDNRINSSNTTALDGLAEKIDWDESIGTWRTVHLPHDAAIYNDVFDFTAGTARDEHASSNNVGGNAATGGLKMGTAWYRKSFTLSDEMKDKNFVVQFDAVQMVSSIYINGHFLGREYSGYTTFDYDITDYLRFDGATNVIAVKAFKSNHSDRWYSGLGIVGSVYLYVTDKVHVPVNGTYIIPVVQDNGKWVTPDFHTVQDMEALRQSSTLNVRTDVENKTAAQVTVSIQTYIYDQSNPNVASQLSENVVVAAGERIKHDQIISIANPKLWSLEEPNLYWARHEIIQNGKIIDSYVTRFGIRYLQLAPGTNAGIYNAGNTLGGLYINGKYTRINGVCEHRDLGSLGMETSTDALERKVRKFKDMGVTVIRTAHDPVSPELIEACERVGMLIFEELTDVWTGLKSTHDYSSMGGGWFNTAADGLTQVFKLSNSSSATPPAFTSIVHGWSAMRWNPDKVFEVPNVVRDVRHMVDRDKNSPSVFCWSTGNEILQTGQSGDGPLDEQWLIATAIKEIDSLENIPYTSIINYPENPNYNPTLGNYRIIRPTPAQNYAALPNPSAGTGTDHAVRGGRYGRPISSAPPTWSSTLTNMYANMALADIGGHNYSSQSTYTAAKTAYPRMNFMGSENVSAHSTRGHYSIGNNNSGYQGSGTGAAFRSSIASSTGSSDSGNDGTGYASAWNFRNNFQNPYYSMRIHRQDAFPWLYGQMVWTGSDYLGEPAPYGADTFNLRSSQYGSLDLAGLEKDIYYYYRSHWTDVPTVRILPQDWTSWTPGTEVPIMVHTNGASVSLYLNGTLLATSNYDTKKSFTTNQAEPPLLEFGKRVFQRGELMAVAYDGPNGTGNIIATDVVRTAGEAASIVLTPDREYVKNDRSDLVVVETKIVDAAGVMLPQANDRITWHVQNGEIISLDNGDSCDLEPFRGKNNNDNRNTSDNRRAFNGMAVAYIRPFTGSVEDVIVTATMTSKDGRNLGSNTVVVESREEIGLGLYDSYTYKDPKITIGVGMAPEMPETIEKVYDNGVIWRMTVAAWDMSGVNANAAGTYTATATVWDGTVTKQAQATVYVKNVASIDPVAVTTLAGVAPSLPGSVVVHYTDAATGDAKVIWDNVASSNYAGEGVFNVSGNIGIATQAVATVSVKIIESVEDVVVSALTSIRPNMPTTVRAKFADGTQGDMDVFWDIGTLDIYEGATSLKVSAGQYQYPGRVQVTGNILGYMTTATVRVSHAVYASDLLSELASGISKDKMLGGGILQARPEGLLPGIEYSKGIATQAGAEVVIDIAGKGYERFQAYVGLSVQNGLRNAPGSVAFKVFFDDETMPEYESPVLTSENGSVFVDLEVTGINKIRLVTVGSGANDLGDWADAKFLSSNIAVNGVILKDDAYIVQSGAVPVLPTEAQVDVGAGELGKFKVVWPTVTAAMFTLPNGVTSDIVTLYGDIAGTTNGVAKMNVVINYQNATADPSFAAKIGSYRLLDDFNRAAITTTSTAVANLTATNRAYTSIQGGHANVNIQKVASYATNGWYTSIWPNTNTSATDLRYVTFVAPPDLKRFVVRNSSTYASPWSANASRQEYGDEDLIISTSPDGTTFTPFTSWVKTNDSMGPNRRDHRLYTATADVPEETRYLRVTFPRFMVGSTAAAGSTTANTTDYRLTEMTYIGGEDTFNATIRKVGDEIAGVYTVPNTSNETQEVLCILALYDKAG
ncbi:MAG: Ig-like domain-containing protein, partial [Oscillospiraceae bacterium]|nr:Ig-like domain-containing protein [Oscillospiraceae bacterium]